MRSKLKTKLKTKSSMGHSDDSGDRASVGARERVVRAAARGVTDAVLDRVTPEMVERVKRWLR